MYVENEPAPEVDIIERLTDWYRRMPKDWYGNANIVAAINEIDRLREEVAVLKGEPLPARARLYPFGYCPHCGQPGERREKRINGNDHCPNGHVYPSTAALQSLNEGK